MKLNFKRKIEQINKESEEINKESEDNNFFAVNDLFKLKKDFDYSEFYPKQEDFTHVEKKNNETSYYINNKIAQKKLIQNNSEVLYSYDNKRNVTKKITKINNGNITDYKVVKYGQTKESALYRFNGNQLQKKAIFFFKDTYKYRGAIYYIKQNTVTGIERITYEKDTQRVKTKTVYKFNGQNTVVTFERYSTVNGIIQSNRIQFSDDEIVSIDSELLKSSVISLSAKKGKHSYNIELIDDTKYGQTKMSYEAPIENISKAFKFHEGDYNDVSILFPDDKICIKTNYQIN